MSLEFMAMHKRSKGNRCIEIIDRRKQFPIALFYDRNMAVLFMERILKTESMPFVSTYFKETGELLERPDHRQSLINTYNREMAMGGPSRPSKITRVQFPEELEELRQQGVDVSDIIVMQPNKD